MSEMKKKKKKLKKKLLKSKSTEIQSPNYVKGIQKEINYIKPHENDDLEWYNEGRELLEKNLIPDAELKFKELVVSQPLSKDGYEGLARVYEITGDKDKAIFFINRAIEASKKFLSDERISELYEDFLKRINNM